MDGALSVSARFPQHEFEIHRLYAQDECFRSICSDYEEATSALSYWEKVAREGGAKGNERSSEYRLIVCELEEEILEALEQSRTKRS